MTEIQELETRLQILRGRSSDLRHEMNTVQRKAEYVAAQLAWMTADADSKWEYVEDWTTLVPNEEARVVIIRGEQDENFVMEYGEVYTDPSGTSRYVSGSGSNFTAVGYDGKPQEPSPGIKVRIWRLLK